MIDKIRRYLENRGVIEAAPMTHNVVAGDNLWNLAKQYNISFDDIQRYNPQIKDGVLHVGDKLRVAPQYREQVVDLRKEREREDVISYDNIAAIQNTPHNGNYVITDKKNNELYIFSKDNQLLYKTSDISTGESGNDYNTITYVDDNGNIKNKAGNNSTPAGISVITGTGSYHGFPSFTRGRINSDGTVEDIASSFHWGKTDKKKASNGCVRINGKTLEDMSKLIGAGTMVYTLPEKGGSRFTLRGGKLNFIADNPYGESTGDKRYWDDYNVRIDKSYSPLTITYNGNNTDEEYNRNVSRYINTVSSGKEALQKKFKLSSDEYNRLAELAVGIAQQESKYGTSNRYNLKQQVPDWMIDLLKGGGNHARSRGLTQIKLNGDNKELRSIYKQLGINEHTINAPEYSALATMSRLAYMYNNEVKGRNFKGARGSNVDAYDALLYKYMGRGSELKNRTATPYSNNYINNVKRYANNFGFYERRKVEI